MFAPCPALARDLRGGALAFRRSTAVMRRGPYLDSAPGRASWNHRIQTGGPSPAPVQPAPGSPVTRRTVDAQNRPDQGYKPHPGTAPAPSIGCHRSTSLRWASQPYVSITVTDVKTVSLHQRQQLSTSCHCKRRPLWLCANDAAGGDGPCDGLTSQDPRCRWLCLLRTLAPCGIGNPNKCHRQIS